MPRRRSTAAGRTSSGAPSTSTSDRPRAVATQLEPSLREIIYFALSSLMVAEERTTTKCAGLVAAHAPEEETTFLANPASRRGAPHAVLRPLPRRGHRRAADDRGPRRARPRAGVGLLPRAV